MKRLRDCPRVTVTWWDAYVLPEDAWIDFPVKAKPRVMRTAGYLLAETDDYVVVAATVDVAAAKVSLVKAIPVGCIRRIDRG